MREIVIVRIKFWSEYEIGGASQLRTQRRDQNPSENNPVCTTGVG